MNVMDKLLAFHCAPTLFGLKPANLISHSVKEDFEHMPDADEAIQKLNAQGIFIERLCGCERKLLTLVYKKDMLIAHLNRPEIWGFLVTQGYPMNEGLDEILRHLKKRVAQTGGFPHEIGVFLGYPLEDVVGFIKHRGQNCKLCGYWKVYGDAEKAKSLFDQFNQCRDRLLCALSDGHSIEACVSVA